MTRQVLLRADPLWQPSFFITQNIQELQPKRYWVTGSMPRYCLFLTLLVTRGDEGDSGGSSTSTSPESQ